MMYLFQRWAGAPQIAPLRWRRTLKTGGVGANFQNTAATVRGASGHRRRRRGAGASTKILVIDTVIFYEEQTTSLHILRARITISNYHVTKIVIFAEILHHLCTFYKIVTSYYCILRIIRSASKCHNISESSAWCLQKVYGHLAA